MKWKAKDDLCGVPGKGYIKASDFSQEDENALIARAKRRGVDVNLFMLGAGFIPADGPQLELQTEVLAEVEPLGGKHKRKRRTKEELKADEGEE